MLRRPMLWTPEDDAGVGGIDDGCLALIRPVYSGGSWAPGDASLHERTVTNTSLTIGAEGTGPWGGTSRAIIDASGAARASCAFATAFRGLAAWVYPTSRPASQAVFLSMYRGGYPNPRTYLSVYPGSTGRVSFQMTAVNASGGVIFNVTSSADYALNEWHFVSAGFPGELPDVSELRIDGSSDEGASSASASPVLQMPSPQAMQIGAYYDGSAYSFSGRLAECIVVSDGRFYDDDFSPPSGPYTE